VNAQHRVVRTAALLGKSRQTKVRSGIGAGINRQLRCFVASAHNRIAYGYTLIEVPIFSRKYSVLRGIPATARASECEPMEHGVLPASAHWMRFATFIAVGRTASLWARLLH